MYREYFGLKEIPFSISPDPRYLYMSEGHQEALAHLLYGIKNDGGFVLLTGEVGTGKTTVCRCLLEQTPENTDIAFILNPKLTVTELLSAICDELRIPYPRGNASIKIFVDKINEYLLDSYAKGRKTVLIIEEAQNLASEVLEQLRLLTNLETNKCKLLQIIMIGQPELQEKLSHPELRQLSQRITARYHLGPLSKKEIAFYVSHRLEVAGGLGRLFPDSTIGKLYRLSKGIPRLINLLCDRSLLGAYVQKLDRVDKRTLSGAAREVFGTAAVQQSRKVYRWVFAGIALAVCIVAAASAYYKYSQYEQLSGSAGQLRQDTLWWFTGYTPMWQMPSKSNMVIRPYNDDIAFRKSERQSPDIKKRDDGSRAVSEPMFRLNDSPGGREQAADGSKEDK